MTRSGTTRRRCRTTGKPSCPTLPISRATATWRCATRTVRRSIPGRSRSADDRPAGTREAVTGREPAEADEEGVHAHRADVEERHAAVVGGQALPGGDGGRE